MDAASQQKILGYFIEEAKEHLETLEQGILELGVVVSDEERMNELFRAAHSVKGGAAMLGFSSIQKVSHRLEDAFKILKEHTVQVDQHLEELFFSAYDVLKELLEKLQSPFGLKDEDGAAVIVTAEPHFVSLQGYLNQLVQGDAAPVAMPEPVAAPVAVPEPVMMRDDSDWGSQVRSRLKTMLALFKQKETADNRQQLQKLCIDLAKLDKDNEYWQTVLRASHKAIANPKYAYRLLAPVIIKEIKQASDCLELGQMDQLQMSENLQQLATKKPQVLVTVDPKVAAQTLMKAFNQQQLSQLVQLLSVKAKA